MTVAHGEPLPLWRQVHCVSRDPGLLWNKDSALALDAPPDDHDPARAGQQVVFANAPGPRTGVWRTHTPSVVRLDDGSYRMYFTESGPGLLWTQSRGRILSAVSADGALWSPEPGVRLGPHAGGAEMQVTSPELVPAVSSAGVQGHRLYFEAIPGKMATDGRGNTLGEAEGSTTIHSAFSTDGDSLSLSVSLSRALARSFSFSPPPPPRPPPPPAPPHPHPFYLCL